MRSDCPAKEKSEEKEMPWHSYFSFKKNRLYLSIFFYNTYGNGYTLWIILLLNFIRNRGNNETRLSKPVAFCILIENAGFI
jgi:hypothetical protein